MREKIKNVKQKLRKNIHYTKEDAVFFAVFAGLLLLVAFLCFYRLDVKYVDTWDEARHGVNAYEMSNGGSLIQNTYLRQADYYNLKPPLSMWVIMTGFRLFGNTVLGLRFFSALFYVILTAAVGLFLRKQGYLEAILACLFLALNMTPFQAHMIRSGDADSIYVLLFTLSMLAMMKIGEDVRWVYVCGFLASLAFLAKSFHAVLIPAIGFLYLVLTGLIKKMGIRHWMIFLGLLFLPVLFWMLLRMRIDGTAFFRAMWETDVLGRTSGELKNNISPFTYYLEYYFGASSGKATVYLCVLVVILIGVFRYPQLLAWERRSEWLGYALWLIVPFAAFSAVTNKLIWYVYPSLIALLVIGGSFAAKLVLDKKLGIPLQLIAVAFVCFLSIYFIREEIRIIDSQGPNEIQEMLSSVGKTTGVYGCEAYVEYLQEDSLGDRTAWCQQDVFMMQLSGDYFCVNGGLEQLNNRKRQTGKNMLLFASKEFVRSNESYFEDKIPVMRSGNYELYLVR